MTWNDEQLLDEIVVAQVGVRRAGHGLHGLQNKERCDRTGLTKSARHNDLHNMAAASTVYRTSITGWVGDFR